MSDFVVLMKKEARTKVRASFYLLWFCGTAEAVPVSETLCGAVGGWLPYPTIGVMFLLRVGFWLLLGG